MQALLPRAVHLQQIYFIITRTCNLFCSHCIRSSGPDVKDTVTQENAFIAIDKLAPHGQKALMFISGGEPTLHPNFQEIVTKACQSFPNVMVNTNGLNLHALKEACRRNPSLKLQISIDGSMESHNIIRGKGTFQKTMGNIRILSELGVKITVATTAGRTNVDSFTVLDQQLINIPFHTWTIKREVIYGRASQQNSLSTDDWNAFVDSVQETFTNKNRIFIQPMFHLSSFSDNAQHQQFYPDQRNCGTGRSKLYINPDLTVFPCACLEELNIADLKTDDAQTVLNQIGLLPIEPQEMSPCQSCPVKQQCMGGCPGTSFHTYGEFGIGDTRCTAISDLVGESLC
ncbi:radical SAM/SPASM domain-containing protein [Alkalihalobacterium alkalinitrilicum]|uniref:radical SAM/SPASM domain-containing protein n=1 Tax=Alkalihalobacterium alkalinitrilicum TaxID=427920 RepID=UPI000995050C|nr:radical SAM protein [Alkalihalobacterium alkalinitrilicum]